MSKPLNKMTVAELRDFTVEAMRRKDRKTLQAVKAETLARSARVIAEGRDTPELIRAVDRLTKGR